MSSGPLSIGSMAGRPRISMSPVSARTIRRAGKLVSISMRNASRLKSWSTLNVRKRRPFHSASAMKSTDQTALGVAGATSEAEYLDGLRQAGLADIEVRDRVIYDASLIRGLVQSELADADSSIAALMDSIGPRQATELIQQMEGKVASISIYARRPTSA